MMNKQAVSDWLCQEMELTIAFDTNILFIDKSLVVLCDKINRLKLVRNKKIQLVVPAPAYLEKLHDLKQRYKDNYDFEKIIQGLDSKGLHVTAFEPRHAEVVAELIGKQFPTDTDWRNFKRGRCLKCLGLTDKVDKSLVLGRGKKCGATVDWLIAGYAYAEKNCLLVTNDKQEEFKGVPLKTQSGSLDAAIDQLLLEVENKMVMLSA